MLMKGMRIKLTDKAAKGLSSRRKSRIDWAARRGIVQWAGNGQLSVLWDGRKQPEEPLPAIAFEKVSP